MGWRRCVLVVASVIGLVVSGMTIPAPASPDRSGDLVFTDRGPVRGVVGDEVRTFQGIPFATPPVGALRFRPPQPAARWRDPLDATAPRGTCPQPPMFGAPGSTTEDCLYLNVTTPRRAHGRVPVMVWIHGGGFTSGAGSFYNAAKLAAEGGVVVVTINYRLGPFGFLALPALDTEHPGIQSGNTGIEDQQAALRWVRRNAAAFGGDPHNVTIFGESAGSSSVCVHLVSPTATGLFSKAIGQSFACTSPQLPKNTAETTGATFAARFGCTDAAQAAECLRAKPVPELLAAWPGGGPVVGGIELPLQPPEAIRTNRFHHVPVMLGNTHDEMRLFVSAQFDALGHPVTPEQYVGFIRATYGSNADRVLALYPLSAFPTPTIALSTVETDFGTSLSTCGHLASYRAFAKARVPVFAYQFADRTAPPLVDLPNFDEGAEHATELNFLFPRLFGAPLTPAQEALSTTMVAYWTNFAQRGNPRAHGEPAWPRFHSDGDVLTLNIGPAGVHPGNPGIPSNCAFWESLGQS
jgi:para-nitrobenzyl esterase